MKLDCTAHGREPTTTADALTCDGCKRRHLKEHLYTCLSPLCAQLGTRLSIHRVVHAWSVLSVCQPCAETRHGQQRAGHSQHRVVKLEAVATGMDVDVAITEVKFTGMALKEVVGDAGMPLSKRHLDRYALFLGRGNKQ